MEECEVKKYELIDHRGTLAPKNLKRLRALRDFGGVKKGDLGGFIEKEENLSHEGDCWISGTAWISGSAHVYDSAKVYGSAQVSGTAWIYGSAHVYDSAQVYGSAWVCGFAQVSDSAQVSGTAHVYDFAQISGSAWVSLGVFTKKNEVLPANGGKYSITVCNSWVRIGCECMTREKWNTELQNLSIKHNETTEDIQKWLGVADALIKCLEV